MSAVRRFSSGSRVPGWDVAADLSKDPAGIPDPATTVVSSELRDQIEAHMANYPDRRSAALPALAAAQQLHGWCSPEAINQVACVMRLTPAYLESIATFYDMLETSPVGRHSIYVCTNISCSLCGADELYQALLSATADGAGGGSAQFNVRSFECLGACDIAPMASVDGIYVGPLSAADIPPLLDDIRNGRTPLPERQLARRPVADTNANSATFPVPSPQPVGVLARSASESSSSASSAPSEPDIDPGPDRTGPPTTEDRPGPTAALEPSHTAPPHPAGAPHQADSPQPIPHDPSSLLHRSGQEQASGQASASGDQGGGGQQRGGEPDDQPPSDREPPRPRRPWFRRRRG